MRASESKTPPVTIPRPRELDSLAPEEAARAVEQFIGAPQRAGSWVIEPLHVDEFQAAASTLKGEHEIGGRSVPEGEYIHLRRVGGEDPASAGRDGFRARPEVTVMSNTPDEISDHATAFAEAEGRVLITGLGLSMVVSGLLAKPEVEHIDVIEQDADIISMVGPAYAEEPRVTIHRAHAMRWPIPPDSQWDFTWHDIWARIDVRNLESATAESGISYADLLRRFAPHSKRQAAWALPLALAMRPSGELDEIYREEWEAAQELASTWRPPAPRARRPEASAQAPERLLDARVRTPQHVVHRAFPAETIVLNLESGQYHGLNPVAGRMLEAAAAADRPADVVSELAAQYGQPQERIAAELEGLIADLLERGLVEVDGTR